MSTSAGEAATNRRCAPALLETLAGDDDHIVRSQVASNTVSPHLLGQLAADDDTAARGGVASNPASPPHLLEHPGEDPDNDVRWELEHQPEHPAAAAGDPRRGVPRQRCEEGSADASGVNATPA